MTSRPVQIDSSLNGPAPVWESGISGLNFQLTTDSDRFLSLWDGLFLPDSPPATARTISVHAEEGEASVPTEAAGLLIETPETTVYRGENAFWLSTKGMLCAVKPGSIEVSFDDRFWTKTLFDQRNFMLVTMVGLLRLNGIYGFHGNGLVHSDTGIIISGNSGAGKTTLTHALIASGWNYLADDAIAMRSINGEVAVHALRKGFSLTEDARRRKFPPALWDDSSLRELGNGKYLATATASVEKQYLSSCVPSALIFIEIGDTDETRISPIPDTVALVLALDQAAGLLTDTRSAAAQLNVLRDLVNQCACFKIVSGRDVIAGEESARKVSKLILRTVRGEA